VIGACGSALCALLLYTPRWLHARELTLRRLSTAWPNSERSR
jgi:hypothetical protein